MKASTMDEELDPVLNLTERVRPGDHVLMLYERPEGMWELASAYAKYWSPRAKVSAIFTSKTRDVAKGILERHGVDTSSVDFLDGSELYSLAKR